MANFDLEFEGETVAECGAKVDAALGVLTRFGARWVSPLEGYTAPDETFPALKAELAKIGGTINQFDPDDFWP